MSHKRKKKLLPRLLLALVVVLILDFGAAQVLKRINRPDPVPVKNHRVPYGYTFRTNLDVVAAVWGHRTYRLRSNSLGMRDRAPRDVPLIPRGRRVVFIGDSFTMGIGCDYENTFVGLVGQALEEVEVLNAAVDGYSTMHYVEKMVYQVETQGLRCDEVVVCLDLSDVAEDLARRHDSTPVTSTGKPARSRRSAEEAPRLPHLPHTLSLRQWLRANSLLVETLYRIKLWLVPDLPIDQRAVLWTTEDKLYREFGAEGIRLQKENMEKLATVLQRHGIDLTIVVYPWIDQVVRGDLDSRQVRIWREWCAEHGAGFINCFPAFVGRNEDPMQTVFECYIRGDNHFNETGHRIMAEWLLKYMRKGEKRT